MKNNKDYIKWGLTAFFVVLGGFVSYYVIFHIDSLTSTIRNLFVILMPIIDGFILAYLLAPLVNATERNITTPFFTLIKKDDKKNAKRFLSIIITDVLVLWALYVFFSIVIPQIAKSIRTILEQFPSYINTFGLWISKLLNDNPEFQKSVMDFLNQSSMDFTTMINTKLLPQLNSINNVTEMLSQFSGIINVITSVSMSVYSIFKEMWNLVIGFIISIYLLASKELFAAQAKKVVYAFCSVNRANRFISNVRFAHKTFGGFFVGKILDSIIIGVICFAVTSILGTPFCVLISVIIGVTNIIPFFGPFLGAIPSTLLILFIDPLQALYFVIFVIILQQVDGNIIGPKILGSSTGLSSFWVIFSITLFGGIWGILGMIIGVPIFAILFAFMKSLIETRLSAKNLSPETKKYLRLLYIDAGSSEYVEFSENAKKPFADITQILVKGHEKLKINQENENVKANKKNETENDLK
ncbi:MAG: AI-2E family transporter [Lachnospiraceae bacterium]|nr:AI-2E family transporter [Lachnospiraceae bacterium]